MTKRNILECMTFVGSTPSAFEGKKQYVSTGAVDCDHISIDDIELVTYDNRPSRANLTACEGDILFAKMCATEKTLLLNSESADNIYSTGFCAVRAIPSVISTECLYHLLTSEQFLLQKDKNCSGATQKAITNAGLAKIFIQVPSIEEQSLLSKKLSIIKELIAKRQEELVELNNIIKSRFIEMFGDPVSNPMGWDSHQLSTYIDFLTSGSRGWSQYFTESGEYFITIKNVKDCRITMDNVQYVIPPNNAEAKRTRVMEGDLLISITADLGRTGVVTKEIAMHGAYINQHLTCIRLRQNILNPSYAAYFMESEAGKMQFNAKNQNGVKAGLNFDAINSLRVLVPPIELQNKFVSFVETTDKLKFEIKKSLEELEILKKSLMQQYFG